MNEEPKTPPGEALALARFALIVQIQDLLRQGFPLSLALEQVSICPLRLPDGSERLIALRTLEDWWYDYQHSGFDNHFYEVDLSLRTLEVQLRFDPFKLDRVEVYYRGGSFGLAKPVNLHLNSQIHPGSDYEKHA